MPNSIYSVAQVNAYIKNMFAQDFLLDGLMVRGEISNCKYHSSGHVYFTLKDKNSVISCVMFSSQRAALGFRLTEGMKVVVHGRVDVYERDGKYQLYVSTVENDGEGQLFLEFERLKKKLLEMGMFDQSFKQPIPGLSKTIGIVTAPTGAAIRDIINISKRRNPFVQLILYPALVQGAQAADSIVRGIKVLEEKKPDVIIVGRGGGSLEDLWPFNEEIVARAIFDCPIPIISAVGHETDTTISDFAADLRAPTPSAAAELATPDMSIVMSSLSNYQTELEQKIRLVIDKNRFMLDQYNETLKGKSPKSEISNRRVYLMQLEEMLSKSIDYGLGSRRGLLTQFNESIGNLSPHSRLANGYAFLTDMNEKRITGISDINVGDSVKLRLLDGDLVAKVTDRSSL